MSCISFPSVIAWKATWASGWNTRLKPSILVTFSALLNWADRTDDSDGAKLLGQGYVTANCLMNRCLLQSWISGV